MTLEPAFGTEHSSPLELLKSQLIAMARFADNETGDRDALLQEGWFYTSPMDLVLHESRRSVPEAKVDGGPIGECFTNALHYAIDHDLTYVEGYALPNAISLAVSHAWCEDDQSHVYETTWEELGQAYLGVRMDTIEAARIVTEQDAHGIICNDWMRDSPLLRYGVEYLKE